MAQAAKKWAPISEYETQPTAMASRALPNLAKIWQDQVEDLKNAESLRQFNLKLQREWSIETGLIERLYTLDRGVTELLIEKGLDASLIAHGTSDQDPEKVVSMIRDHQEAIEDLFQFIKGGRELTSFYVRQIHQLLTRNQETTSAIDSMGHRTDVPLLRGAYKKRPNNPRREDGSVHQYCPPEQVSSEMDRLLAMHKAHEEAGVPPEVEAAWLHHRFTQIHPFQDGNGRVARCLGTLVFIKAGWFPLVVRDLDRSAYIDALEAADNGDLAPLVRLFSEIAARTFARSLEVSLVA